MWVLVSLPYVTQRTQKAYVYPRFLVFRNQEPNLPYTSHLNSCQCPTKHKPVVICPPELRKGRLSIALRLMIQSCLLQKYSWSALNWVLRRKLGRLIRRCVFWTHYDPWNLIWIQPLHLFLGSASMLPSDAGIHGNIWWRLQGSWGPRDQSEAKFGPDWSSGSISWALVSLEAPYNVTLDACVQGSYAGSGVSWYTCLPSESLSHRDHFRKEFVFHVSTNSSQEGYGGAKQGSQRTCANQISLVPQHFQEVKRWMPTLWK